MSKKEKINKILKMMEELLNYADEEEINKTYASTKFTLETYKELFGEGGKNND